MISGVDVALSEQEHVSVRLDRQAGRPSAGNDDFSKSRDAEGGDRALAVEAGHRRHDTALTIVVKGARNEDLAAVNPHRRQVLERSTRECYLHDVAAIEREVARTVVQQAFDVQCGPACVSRDDFALCPSGDRDARRDIRARRRQRNASASPAEAGIERVAGKVSRKLISPIRDRTPNHNPAAGIDHRKGDAGGVVRPRPTVVRPSTPVVTSRPPAPGLATYGWLLLSKATAVIGYWPMAA